MDELPCATRSDDCILATGGANMDRLPCEVGPDSLLDHRWRCGDSSGKLGEDGGIRKAVWSRADTIMDID